MVSFIDFDDFKIKKDLVKILKNKILIYPTDTVYGIGCNATKKGLVKKVFDIKKRDYGKPVSVIAPSKDWIFKNVVVSRKVLTKYLPGPYTIIGRKKSKKLDYVSKDSLGVRIPDHEISELISKANIPFITTSANISGELTANTIFELSDDLVRQVDFVIDNGPLSGTPSTLIDVRNNDLKVIKR